MKKLEGMPVCKDKTHTAAQTEQWLTEVDGVAGAAAFPMERRASLMLASLLGDMPRHEPSNVATAIGRLEFRVRLPPEVKLCAGCGICGISTVPCASQIWMEHSWMIFCGPRCCRRSAKPIFEQRQLIKCTPPMLRPQEQARARLLCSVKCGFSSTISVKKKRNMSDCVRETPGRRPNS